MKAPLSYVPVLPAALGLVAGILLYEAGSVVAVLAGVVSAAAFVALYLRHWQYAAFFPLAVLAGLLITHASRLKPLPDEYVDGNCRVVAKVTDANAGESTMTYILRVDSLAAVTGKNDISVGEATHVNAKCVYTSYSLIDTIPVGSTIELIGKIKPLVAREDLPGCRSYDGYLLSQGISYRLTARSGVNVISYPGWFRRTINSATIAIERAIVNLPVSEETSAFLLAVILGEKDYIDPEVTKSFRTLGLAHLLALSGMHVGVLAMIIGMLMLPVRLLPRGRAVASMVMVALIWLYAEICGMGPSIVRAAVMITVFTVAGYLQRGYFVYNSLLLSIIVILCINPLNLFTPGFQLSIVAVASIISFSAIIPKSWQRRRALFFISNMVLVPVSAIIGTGIISAYYFHTFPIAFLPSNIIGALLFPVLYTCGVVCTLFELVGIHFELLGRVIDFCYHGLVNSTSLVSGIFPDEVRGIDFTPWAILPYGIGVVLLVVFLHYRKHRSLLYLALSMVFLSGIVAMSMSHRRPDGEMHILANSRNTHLIFRVGERAEVYTLCDDAARRPSGDACNKSYALFLASRGCADTFAVIDHYAQAECVSMASLPYIKAGDATIYIADGDRLPVSVERRVDYLLLAPDFTGDAAVAATAVNADTVLFAPSTHPARRGKWRRQLDGAVPAVDLHDRPFHIYW